MNRPGFKQSTILAVSKQQQLQQSHNRKLSPSQYSRALSRIAIAQILQCIGFQSAHSTALDILVDILERYTMLIAKSARDFAELCNRTEPTLEDLAVTFGKYRVSVDDLSEFVKWVDTPEFALQKHAKFQQIGLDVEMSQEDLAFLNAKKKIKKTRREYLGFCDDPDNKELLERQSDEEFEYVYDYMPLMTRDSVSKFEEPAHLDSNELEFPTAMLTDTNDVPDQQLNVEETKRTENQSVVVKEGKKYINNAWKSMYEPKHIKRYKEPGQIVARQPSISIAQSDVNDAEIKSNSPNLVTPSAKLPTSYKKPSNNKYKHQIFLNAVNVCNKSSTNINQLADELIEEEVAARLRQAQQQKELLDSQMIVSDVGKVEIATTSEKVFSVDELIVENRVKESDDLASDQMLEAYMNKYTTPAVNRVSNLKIRIKENSVVSTGNVEPTMPSQPTPSSSTGAVPKLKLTKINNNSEFNFATTSALSSTSQFLNAYNEDKQVNSAISPDNRVFFTSHPNLEDENAMDGLNSGIMMETDMMLKSSNNNISEPLIWKPEIGSDSPQNDAEPNKSDTNLARDREAEEVGASSKADSGANKKKKKKKKNKNKEKQKEKEKIHKKQKKHKKNKDKSKEKNKDEESSFVTMGEESGNENATTSKKKDKELKKKLKKEKKRLEKMAAGADAMEIQADVQPSEAISHENKVEVVPPIKTSTTENAELKSTEEHINPAVLPPPLPKLKLKIGQQDMTARLSDSSAVKTEPSSLTSSEPSVKPLKISFGGKPMPAVFQDASSQQSHLGRSSNEPKEPGEIVRHPDIMHTVSSLTSNINLSTFMPNPSLLSEQPKPPSAAIKKPFDPMKKLNASKSSSQLVNPNQLPHPSNAPRPNADELSFKKKKISEPLDPASLALYQSQNKMFFKTKQNIASSDSTQMLKQETTTELESPEWHQLRVKQEEEMLREQLNALNASRMKSQTQSTSQQSSQLHSQNIPHKKSSSISPSSQPGQKPPKKHSAPGSDSIHPRPNTEITTSIKSIKPILSVTVTPPETNPITSIPPVSTGSGSNDIPSEMKIIGTAVTDVVSNQLWICPACKRHDESKPMIGCDSCDDWYHWSCIGIVEEPPENQNWYCHKCGSKTENTATADASMPSPSEPNAMASDYLMSLKKKKKKSS